MRERYEDNSSTHPDFNPDLWMEVRSSDGPNKIEYTGSPTLWLRTCGRPVVTQSLEALNQYRASNLRSSRPYNNTWLISQKKYKWLSTNYEQNTAQLTEKYKQLSANYEQLHQMVMSMTSQSGDTCAAFFWPYSLGNNQPPPPLAPPLI